MAAQRHFAHGRGLLSDSEQPRMGMRVDSIPKEEEALTHHPRSAPDGLQLLVDEDDEEE